MPTYEYRCDQCGLTTERFHAMGAEPRLTCPECGSDLRRVFSGGASVIVREHKGADALAGHCESREPCCGRETRCDTRPCDR
jgi:putative FmdB family regulatory protein